VSDLNAAIYEAFVHPVLRAAVPPELAKMLISIEN